MPDLHAIVQRMVEAGENEDDIAAVIQHYPSVTRSARPVSAEDFTQDQQPQGSAVGRFASGVWDMLNPVGIVKGLGHAVAHPIDTATGLVDAHIAEGRKAYENAREGRLSEAVGHGAAAVLPVLGPMAATVGEQIGSGDVAGGLGHAAGLLAPFGASALPATARLGAFARNANPLAAEAVDLGLNAGVPIDAATATGNRFIAAAQHVSDRSLGGSLVAGRAGEAQARGLATLGEQLAAKGAPLPVTAEQAGEGVRSAVLDQIKTHARDADAAYDTLRKIEANPANAKPVPIAGGGTQLMPLPVDVRPARAAFRPIYEDLARQAELAPSAMMGDKARAFMALDKLMNGPTHAPLSTVDAVLGDLKTFARKDVPEMRSAGQGAIAGTIKHLESVVQRTAADAGPEALDALKAGRASTVAKYGAADVLDSLHAEPVKTVNRLTSPKDAAIDQLRDVAKQAPAELPKIGRAFLDDLLTQATSEGGFGHAKAVAAKWERLGPQTKVLLYQDPGYVNDLDRFFQLAKMTADTPNPSGTAHTLLTAGQGGLMLTNPVTGTALQLGTAALSGLLHSKTGVRVLTKGLTIPLKNTVAGSAWLAEFMAATNPNGPQTATAPAR